MNIKKEEKLPKYVIYLHRFRLYNITVMWIRIRSDPHHFGLPDPDQGKKSAKIMGNSHKNRQKSPQYYISEHGINYTYVSRTKTIC